MRPEHAEGTKYHRNVPLHPQLAGKRRFLIPGRDSFPHPPPSQLSDSSNLLLPDRDVLKPAENLLWLLATFLLAPDIVQLVIGTSILSKFAFEGVCTRQCPQIAEFYEKFYASKGINIMKQAKATAFEGSGKAERMTARLYSMRGHLQNMRCAWLAVQQHLYCLGTSFMSKAFMSEVRQGNSNQGLWQGLERFGGGCVLS
eukprot:1150131-Pelagomonas_calceolata.AAC.6